MTERQIPFKAPMVMAILSGAKSQTRRVVKPQPNNIPGKHAPIEPYLTSVGTWNWVLSATLHGLGDPFPCPYGRPGDRLWVREAWRSGKLTDRFPPREMTPHVVWYEADGAAPEATSGKLRPGMFMPRWASRITLEVTGVRVERLQSISEADAMAEGAELILVPPDGGSSPHVEGYRVLWESINGQGSWEINPWVWVVEFKTFNVK